MFYNFEEDLKKVLIKSKKEMMQLKHAYIGTEHIILSMLKNENLKLTKIFNKHNIEYDNFKLEIIKIFNYGKSSGNLFVYSNNLKRIINEFVIFSRDNNNKLITLDDFIIEILKECNCNALRILLNMNINIELLINDILIYKNKISNSKLLLDEFGHNLNQKVLNCDFDPVFRRDNEINRLIEILCRKNKNNPLLIGDAGVGKTAIVEELANRIVKGLVPDKLMGSKLYSISMASLVSNTKYRGEFEDRINKILKELEQNNNIILFIDEIHTLVGAGGAEGAIDASNILKPYLARGKIKVIGATTTNEYKKHIEEDKALSRRFQIINVIEPNNEDLRIILLNIKKTYELFHNVKIDDNCIDIIIDLSNKYLNYRNQPDKSIDLLDEVCSYVSLKKTKREQELIDLNIQLDEIINNKNKLIRSFDYKSASNLKDKEIVLLSTINKLKMKNKPITKEITVDDIKHVLSNKIRLPRYKNDYNIKKEVNNLKSKIIGQDDIIEQVLNTIINYNDNKPLSLLFNGSSGVGKTYFAKCIAEEFNINLLILNMNEYCSDTSINKLIGTTQGYVGYNDKNTILDKIKSNPISLILIENIDKANKRVMDLICEMLDEGVISNSFNENIYFSNCIFIFTNTLNNKVLGYTKNNDKNEVHSEIFKKISNKFDFNDLNVKEIKKIIKTKSKKKLSTNTVNKILNECNFHRYGAKKIDDCINKYVNNDVNYKNETYI